MKLEVGKKYVTRDNSYIKYVDIIAIDYRLEQHAVGVLVCNDGDTSLDAFNLDGGYMPTYQGIRLGDKDLVAEYEDPNAVKEYSGYVAPTMNIDPQGDHTSTGPYTATYGVNTEGLLVADPDVRPIIDTNKFNPTASASSVKELNDKVDELKKEMEEFRHALGDNSSTTKYVTKLSIVVDELKATTKETALLMDKLSEELNEKVDKLKRRLAEAGKWLGK